MVILLAVGVCCGLAYWLVMAYAAIRGRSVGTLPPSGQRPDWPSLAVVVPACDEAEDIEAAAHTLIAQDYPGLEIVLVDDRSADGTGAIVDRLAASDARTRAIHITELPPGWLGKVNALHTGIRAVNSELVLFTDADVHFAPDALKAVVNYMQGHSVDHLAGFPRLKPAGLWVGAVLSAFLRQFIAAMRPWKVSDPQSRAFIGVGAFNLIRREAFLQVGGFEWLRMEIADDAALGMMMKRAGRPCDVLHMTNWLSLHWHRTLRQAIRGAEKSWSCVCGFSLARTVVFGLTVTALELCPLWSLLPLACPSVRWVGWLGLGVIAAYVVSTLAMAHSMRQRPVAHLLSILTAPLSFVIMIRTAILGRRRGGALWRGTLYPTEALRAGMRMKFP